MADDATSSPKVDKKGIWGWMLFDWAAQPFHTLILTFIFRTVILPSHVAQRLSDRAGTIWWGWMLRPLPEFS